MRRAAAGFTHDERSSSPTSAARRAPPHGWSPALRSTSRWRGHAGSPGRPAARSTPRPNEPSVPIPLDHDRLLHGRPPVEDERRVGAAEGQVRREPDAARAAAAAPAPDRPPAPGRARPRPPSGRARRAAGRAPWPRPRSRRRRPAGGRATPWSPRPAALPPARRRRARARGNSAASLSGVPVPCALTKPTSSGVEAGVAERPRRSRRGAASRRDPAPSCGGRRTRSPRRRARRAASVPRAAACAARLEHQDAPRPRRSTCPPRPLRKGRQGRSSTARSALKPE